MRKDNRLIFEKSVPGRKGYDLPQEPLPDYDLKSLFPEEYLRDSDPNLPEVTELDVVRHYTNLSQLNHSVDTGFYPLGSCTMKYNPKLNDFVAAYEGFHSIHPYQPADTIQGALELMYLTQEALKEISGMDEVTLQPAAGAHGEYTGLRLIQAYHNDRGDLKRKTVIVPDSAHGTNPATAIMCGYEVVETPSNRNGTVDFDAIRSKMDDTVAAIMLTNPNTLGLFERDILEIANVAHENGILLYYDGANMNAIMGVIRPGDMGFDVLHFNLHKTLSTPHGMGGPGSGAVGVKKFLRPYLPVPLIGKDSKEGSYLMDYALPKSIGKVRSFYGNFNVVIRALAYIMSMGCDGLKHASEMAVLNANFLKRLLEKDLKIPYDGICMHEFVADGSLLKQYGVRTLDLAKRLLDFGVHPPTIYFPLIVSEALMIEPTETESKEELEQYAALIRQILHEAKTDPELLKTAPTRTPVRRLDELGATKKPIVRYVQKGE